MEAIQGLIEDKPISSRKDYEASYPGATSNDFPPKYIYTAHSEVLFLNCSFSGLTNITLLVQWT